MAECFLASFCDKKVPEMLFNAGKFLPSVLDSKYASGQSVFQVLTILTVFEAPLVPAHPLCGQPTGQAEGYDSEAVFHAWNLRLPHKGLLKQGLEHDFPKADPLPEPKSLGCPICSMRKKCAFWFPAV